ARSRHVLRSAVRRAERMGGRGDPDGELRRDAGARRRGLAHDRAEAAREVVRRGDRLIVLLIPCPWCGHRDEVEFRYGGQAGISYPTDPDALSDEEWADFLFMRDNPRGDFRE